MKGLPFLAIFSSLALVAATWRIRVSQLVGMAKSSTFPPFTTCVIQKKPDFDPIEHLLKIFFLPAHLAGRQIVAGRLTITRPTVKPIGPWQLL